MFRLRYVSTARPLAILAACIVAFVLIDAGHMRFLSVNTVRSALQTFATLAPVALGLGLAMMVREFDLSIAGLFGLAGCAAVLTGGTYPLLGLAVALGVGLAVGLIQGAIMVSLRLDSIGVTLGGLLVTGGIALVVSNNRVIGYGNIDVSILMGQPLLGVFTVRSLVAVALVLVAAAVFHWGRIGRDIVAVGSNRQGAETAGVPVRTILVGVFGFSGAMTALSGGLLSYSLASASPGGLSDVLVPAAVAAILGGVSLSGGTGRPLSIAVGVLVLSVLRAGSNAVGAPPFVNELTIGAILMAVAIAEGPYLFRRLLEMRRAAGCLAGPRR